jgi:chromosome segregation ATPase
MTLEQIGSLRDDLDKSRAAAKGWETDARRSASERDGFERRAIEAEGGRERAYERLEGARDANRNLKDRIVSLESELPRAVKIGDDLGVRNARQAKLIGELEGNNRQLARQLNESDAKVAALEAELVRHSQGLNYLNMVKERDGARQACDRYREEIRAMAKESDELKAKPSASLHIRPSRVVMQLGGRHVEFDHPDQVAIHD